VARPAQSLLLAVSFLSCLAFADGVARASPPVTLEPPEVGVPFGCGMSFPVSQTHKVGSHLGNDAWAWDFRMPEGTPVVAALDGVVRLARGDSEEGGCDPTLAHKANYVVIAHAGNLETQYLHFTTVSVVPGQPVRRGELLGYSGKTGWACGAHLHFKVATPVSAGWNNPSVEARLAGHGDPELESSVSSAACSAPREVFAQQPARAPRSPRAVGATPRGTVGSARGVTPPVERPLSAGGSPLTATSPSAPPARPIVPGLRGTEAERLDGAPRHR
jgi:murein DD-endopeptidase MepM/ murein hydrolase activator NlpD